jgi:hypothetical protein
MVAFLSAAGSNLVADENSHKGALKSGAQLWAENCVARHEVKPQINFNAAEIG